MRRRRRRRGSRRWRRCAFRRRHRRQDLQHLPRHWPAGRAEGWRQGRVGQARQGAGRPRWPAGQGDFRYQRHAAERHLRRLLGRRAESRDQAYVRSVTTPGQCREKPPPGGFFVSAVRVFPAGGSSRRQTGSKLPATHSPEGIVLSRTCSIDAAVDHLLQTIEGPIRMGLPLGLGKPNRLVNALYQRLRTLPERQLTLYTALSLGRPAAGGDLQRRFLEPFAERVFADYPELDYLHALRRDELPANIRVEEFYLQPGSLLDSAPAQQHYISCNYSHVARDINAKGVNAVAQLVARHPERPGKLSLACNPDITLDLLPMLEKRRAAGETIVAIGMVHDDLPYLPGDAEVEESVFDLLIDAPAESSRLFSTPNMPVNLQDHCIGLHASALVRDGGTLQIGIGSMGDALTAALLLRQRDNATYRALIDELGVRARWAETVERDGGLEPFRRGLYGCSEMFVPGLLALAEAGVLSRRVYPDEARQRAAERGEAPVEGGVWLHGGFFLGPLAFYRRLREMSLEERAGIGMTGIGFVNNLYRQEELKRLQRRDARFINSAFTVTLLGAGVADQLEDGRVLSGVGGQYNFVAQAHELEGARSILMLRSWRESGGEVSSNIVWQYAHTTIPRHLRDMVVTEYGIADLRGKNDAEVIAALLAIADSRFQQALAEQARAAGKLPKDFVLPERYRNNTPERLQALHQAHAAALPEFPLGSDFDEVEQDLLRALGWLKRKLKLSEILELGKATLDAPEPEAYPAHLRRMDLDDPQGLREELYQRLLLAGLRASQEERG
ncbi:putative acetyl-CoA hydrolase/transferase [Pseudomonas aeruginosa MH27]|nr:putative acetyl-CoA hydrolase/transferase [Pseudomonas aeruginosa MH27]